MTTLRPHIEDYLRGRRRRGEITNRTLSHYFRGWARGAGVKVRALDGRSAHGGRRTAGSDVMEASGDIRVAQALLGHARIETTARSYLRPVPLGHLRSATEAGSAARRGPVAEVAEVVELVPHSRRRDPAGNEGRAA